MGNKQTSREWEKSHLMKRSQGNLERNLKCFSHPEERKGDKEKGRKPWSKRDFEILIGTWDGKSDDNFLV